MNRSKSRLNQMRVVQAFITLPMIVALFSGRANGQLPAAAAPLKAIAINGTTLHYVERGSGTPIVFVHGSLGDYRTFQPQFDALSSNFRVVAYSRRFHPPNDVPAGVPSYALQVHVDDLAELVKVLGLGPCHFVGASYGAYVALAFSLQHPDLVRSLVLGEPPVFPLLQNSSVGRGLLEAFRRNAIEPAREAFRAGELETGLRRFIDGVMGEGTFDRMPPEARKRVMIFGPEMRLEMLTDSSIAMTPLACEALAKLSRPVLLISGDRSVPMFHVVTRELEQCLEGETHVMLPDADHGLHGRNPAFYLESVKVFLAR
ncbi:putative hydrolase [Luteitalea pratensis]|uniref:Putative hydrolase n=1 Tax=Luteitalea pratensis TaxID=1855912 RepID=A0A143PJ97_LUTPR|nr:alpha/beta hydrolase [Luteitalea pratensis]AMY08635.1 putative hydrolase [Luteitalea pratensis]